MGDFGLYVETLSSKIFDYTKICKTVLSLDPKIRFAGVINERGRLVAGGMKENVTPLENEKDDEINIHGDCVESKDEKRI